MWPMLLNLTRDECRRTLRRLELEAYSNMMSVLRAQGPLEESRKKLLEELRAVLRISNDRHSAEARRVANDELLATIAENVFGPNTGLAWICEGRRRIPLLPRGIPQTIYTEIADKLAEEATVENRRLREKLEAESFIAPKSDEEEIPDANEHITEGGLHFNENTEELYSPLAMEDQAAKLWDTELICRKRKLPDSSTIPDDVSSIIKNKRNIPVNTNQKHLNLSQIYSKFSQPPASKQSGQSKHSYNQVSKVSTSKSNQHGPRSTSHKPRGARQSSKKSQNALLKSKVKKHQNQPLLSPNKQYNPSLQLDYAGPPSTFQASYAQSLLGTKTQQDYDNEIKTKVLSPGIASDSPTMQLLTQPATVPHEMGVSEDTHLDEPTSLQAQSTPLTKHAISGKPCHLIIKKRGEIAADKNLHTSSDFKVLQKPSEGIKLLSNRQVIVAPSSAQKALNTGKLLSTKVIGSIPKSQSHTPIITDKMIVVSKPTLEQKSLSNSKIFIQSSAITPKKDLTTVTSNTTISNRTTETLTPKGIPATDLKVSAKTFVLNSKSGQKMVVLPAKSRAKPVGEGQVPVLHFKGLSTAMKLVPVTCQAIAQATKSAMTVVSKPALVSTVSSSAKIVSVEPIKTANMADIIPVKGLTPITTPKITNPIVRPVNTKGNVIVVQKRATLGKALTFSKNCNDMSKIIMGKNVNQLLQASKPDQADVAKRAGNVIVLELNNDQSGRTTTMSEILDSRSSTVRVSEENNTKITADTPVLFDSQIAEETCNASSLDSASESIEEIVPMEDSIIEKEPTSNYNKDPEGAKDSTSVTDWEIELETVTRKKDDDKLNSLHLDLGMSSDSDNEFLTEGHKPKNKHSSQESIQRTTPSGESSEMYSSSSGMSVATRTLLSQLQDEGSSSNDSSFALKSKSVEKLKDTDKIDKSESEALSKAKEKLSEKVAEPTSQQKRIDIYSTAITTADINLDSFSYLDEGMLVGDDVFQEDGKTAEPRRIGCIDEQLSRLLGEDSANSTDSQTTSEHLPCKK